MKVAATAFIALLFGCSLLAAEEGASEVDKLMKDRPAVGAVIERHDSIRKWLVRAFAGAFSKSKIRWRDDDSDLPTNCLGKHSYEDSEAVIVVSRKPSPVDQLTILVYECVNVTYEASYRSLDEAASAGRIQREDFVAQNMRTEHKATLGAQRVLKDNFVITDEEASKAISYHKLMGTPRDFASFVDYYQKNKRQEFDANDYYRSVYDQLFAKKPRPPLRIP